MTVLVWVTEESWMACVDATLVRAPADEVTLLHVTDAGAVDAAQGASDILGTVTPPVPPDAGFLGLRAEARHTLALRLIAAGRIPEAVAPADLAIADYVSLAAISDAHPVIVSLQNLSQALAAAELDAAALDAQQAALRLTET